MIDIYLSLIQAQNKCLDNVTSPDINIELYSSGFFDGLMGLNAELPHLKDYWDGYQIGYRDYCCGLLGLEIPQSETDTSNWHVLATA